MKRILICCLLAFTCMSAVQAQETKKEKVKEHISNHFKPYGFIRNYFSVDTRENVAGTGDLFNYLPKDNNWNQTEAEAVQYVGDHMWIPRPAFWKWQPGDIYSTRYKLCRRRGRWWVYLYYLVIQD